MLHMSLTLLPTAFRWSEENLQSRGRAASASRAARLTCGDLQTDRPDPRLMMPSSFKGAQKKITHRPVPITPALGVALKRATSDRPGDAPLLLKRGGSAWQATNTSDHRDLFRRAVERAGLDPDAEGGNDLAW